MLRGSVKTALVATAAALTLAGCQSVDQEAIDAQALACPEGSDCYDAPVPIGPGSSMEVETGEFYFEIVSGVAVDGPVEITLDNVGEAVHNFRIDAAAGDNKKVEAGPGEVQTGTLELFAGEYVYYCDIPGHRAAGMEGRLTVYQPDEAPADAGGGGSTESPGATESPTAQETSSPSGDGGESPSAQPTATETATSS